MKKTNDTGYIFRVVLAVSLSAVALIAVAEALFGVVAVFTTAVCLIPVCFAWMVWSDKKIAEQNYDKQYMSDEAFREKYCK
jgi:hypothetical protein